MKNSILMVLAVNFYAVFALGQEKQSKDMIDGAYTALFSEAGTTGQTKDKLIQLVENNDTQMLAVASCKKCFPALYTYNLELSAKLKKTVFSNSIGLYVIRYDTDSFIIVMPSLQMDEDFSYLNFYGKSPSEVAKMTKNKIEAFALVLLDYL